MHFSECYQILGLTPGCDWSEVQTAYRRQVQKWHPDRYPQHSDEQIEAGQRMQELNKAYTMLSDYYRSQGALPFETRKQESQADAAEAASGTTASRTSTAADHSDYVYQTPKRPPAREVAPALSAWIAVILIALIGYYIYLGFAIHEEEIGFDQEVTDADSAAPTGTPKPHSRNAYKDPNAKSFGLGSTPGEVLEAQGIPTHTAGDLWFYGDSEVYFQRGVVASWQSSPGFPLNITSTGGAAGTSAAPRKIK